MSTSQMRLATGEHAKPLSLRVNLTEAAVARLNPKPGKRQTWYHDTKQRGLVLLVTDNGAKAYYFYRKMNGRPVRLRLGSPATCSVEQARKLAVTAHEQMNAGTDPLEARREERAKAAAAITLETAWERYRDGRLNLTAKSSTIVSDKSRWKTCLADWGNRRLESITTEECTVKHRAIAAKRGGPSADKAMKLLRRIFAWNLPEAKNPCGGKRIAWYVGKKSDHRSRYLTADELEKFNAALDAENNQTLRDYLKMLLLAGQRRSNTATMRWDEIDLRENIWRIKGDNHKTGEDTLIVLSAAAVALLRERQRASEAKARQDNSKPSDYVFPALRADSKHPHIVEPRYALERVCKRAGITDLTVHDLRRTVGVQMALNGANEMVIGAALGHRDRESTRRYSEIASTHTTVRQAVESIARVITSATADGNHGRTKSREEVKLRRRASVRRSSKRASK